MAATADANAPQTTVNSQTTKGKKQTNNTPLVPVDAASITAVEPLVHGAVPH